MPKVVHGRGKCVLHCMRCTATTKTGRQCSRRTCVMLPVCWQHLTSMYGLVISKSSIPGAGQGLFVWKPGCPKGRAVFRAGQVIACHGVDPQTWYSEYVAGDPSRPGGIRRTDAQIDAVYGHGDAHLAPYSMEYEEDDIWDFNCYRYFSSMANDARGTPYETNCTILLWDRGDNGIALVIQAVRTVHNGDELFWSYGDYYWRGVAPLPDDAVFPQAVCNIGRCRERRGSNRAACAEHQRHMKAVCADPH